MLTQTIIEFSGLIGILLIAFMVIFLIKSHKASDDIFTESQKALNSSEEKVKSLEERLKAKSRKAEIINQLNQFVRNGNDLLLKIDNTHINQFHSKFPLKRNEKPSLVDREVAEWSLVVYNYLKANVPSQAEYYNRLSTRNIPSIYSKNTLMTPQQKHRAIVMALMEENIERIIKIIRGYADSSGN